MHQAGQQRCMSWGAAAAAYVTHTLPTLSCLSQCEHKRGHRSPAATKPPTCRALHASKGRPVSPVGSRWRRQSCRRARSEFLAKQPANEAGCGGGCTGAQAAGTKAGAALAAEWAVTCGPTAQASSGRRNCRKGVRSSLAAYTLARCTMRSSCMHRLRQLMFCSMQPLQQPRERHASV